MSEFWTELESKLRTMEAEEEFDLFAIGYVIPQVALAHAEAEQLQDEDGSQQKILINYIQRSVDQDNINDQDRLLIEQVLDAALGNS
ncbi:MAG: hypothetical protein HWE27_11555 [Gammaproteobacteria bacterium]|nr:hypothetical protein [Gammaproteobacteria bacterium]